MSKRHGNAILISDGACNPSGIAHAIVEACQEIRAEPHHRGTDELRADPALRLMVHQLAFLMGVDGSGFNWFDARDICRDKAAKAA